MKKHINYSPDILEAASLQNLLPVIPYAYIDLANTGPVETVQLVLNIPSGSMLNIGGFQISELQQTTCGCSYRVCTLGITLTNSGSALTSVPVPIASPQISGAQLLMIEIYDEQNPTGRPKGKVIVGRNGII